MRLKRFFCISLGMMVAISCMMTVPALAESKQTTLYYTVQATVIYRDYDGTQTTQKVEPGSLLKEPQPKGKPNCTFEGWRNEKTGKLWNFSDPVTEHLTLVASYIEETTKASGNSGSSGNSSGGSSGGGNQSQNTQTSQQENVKNEETIKSTENTDTKTAVATEEINSTLEESEAAEMVSDEKLKINELQSKCDKQNDADLFDEMAWNGKPLTKTVSVEHGTISFRIEVKTEGIGAKMEISSEEFLNMLLKNGTIIDKEWHSVTQGDSMEFVLFVQDTGTEISEQSRSEMEKKANGYTIGQYLDISLFKYYGNKENGQEITETPEPLTISLQVPEYLINTDDTIERSYIILRNHNGVTEILDSTYQEDSHIVTFQTNQFSEYAIAYQDMQKTNKNLSSDQTEKQLEESITKQNIETTFGYGMPNISVILGGIGILFFFILIILLRRKKKSEKRNDEQYK